LKKFDEVSIGIAHDDRTAQAVTEFGRRAAGRDDGLHKACKYGSGVGFLQ
jgi:hypothetical protein